MTAPDPMGPILITLRDVYDALRDLDSKVSRLISQDSSHVDDLRDHEQRLRSLERGRWPLPALAAVVSIAALILAALQYGN